MDIFFADPSEVPLPPAEVRLRLLQAEPYPDGRRVRVYLEIDPFQRRPSIELTLSDAQDSLLAETSIIELMNRKLELVMHVRGAAAPGLCALQAVLYYAQLNEPDAAPSGAPPEPVLSERQVVDRARFDFSLNQEG